MDIDKHILCKVVVDYKTKELKIILGKFDTDIAMINAAEGICSALNVEFVPELLDEETPYH